MEQGQQETLNMQSIDISIGGNNHTIEVETADVKGITRPGAEHINNRTDLFVFNNAFQVRLGYIERLPFEFENCLELRETPLASTSTSGIALDDIQFRPRVIIGVATQELFGERCINQFAILFIASTCKLFHQLGFVASLLHLLNFL